VTTTPPADQIGRHSGGTATAATSTTSANRQLALSTVGFALCFWAWALISPLATRYADDLNLSAFEQSLLVAVPVLVGSLGRIPVGALTDAVGARRMFPIIALLTILPVLFVGYVASDSYPAMLVGGFFLGLGGTSFAIGVPHVNGWFAPERRGTAIGIFGMGMGGTAISAFTTVRIADKWGDSAPFALVAVLLAIYGAVAAMMLRDASSKRGSPRGFVGRAWQTLKLPVSLQLSFLYAVGFGGFVAFSVYLPAYLKNAYDLSQNDAALRTAGFVVLAVIARPLGGWLSDRYNPVPVLTGCFIGGAVLAALAAFERPLMPVGTIAFLGLAAVLGGAAGATFALVAEVTEPAKVGAVTGIVGAAGGLGGFIPPLLMGAVYGALGDYSLGFVLLALTAAAAAVFTWLVVGRTARTRAAQA
jgi:MFS transporter, NNP family, nitrate/nitrite transporter